MSKHGTIDLLKRAMADDLLLHRVHLPHSTAYLLVPRQLTHEDVERLHDELQTLRLISDWNLP